MVHMMGNLLLFVGADAYNKYAYVLTSNPLLYVAEAGLVLTLLMHIWQGFALTFQNRSARPTKYAMTPSGDKAPRFQSRFMAFHGTLILVFVILHLITFKYGPHYTTTVNGVEMRDLYKLVVEVFQSPGYMAWYAVCLIGVGLHLSHGFYSAFATLGVFHPRVAPGLSKLGYLYALVVAAGFMAPPIFVFTVTR